jgi:hypothetical protein
VTQADRTPQSLRPIDNLREGTMVRVTAWSESLEVSREG